MGLKVVVLDDMSGQGLNPLRLNGGHHPGEHPTGLHDLGGHNPFRASLGDLRTGKDQDFAVSCCQVFLFLHFHRHLAQETRQNRLVQRFITGGILVDHQFLFPADQGELAMDIPPFPHPHPTQETLLADLFELILGQFLTLFFVEVPDIQ